MNRSSRHNRFSSRFSTSSNSRLNAREATEASIRFDFMRQAWPGTVATLNRASAGSYTDSDNVLKFAANNTPRFDYLYGRNAAGNSNASYLGLLIEGPSTNLARYTEAFTVAGDGWTYNGMTGGTILGNNPANSGSPFQFTQNNAVPGALEYAFTTGATASIHTFSVWVQGTSTTSCDMEIVIGGSPVAITSKIMSGHAATVSVAGNVASISNLVSNTSPVQNGWTRVAITTVAALSATTTYSVRLWPRTKTSNTVGSSVAFYGAQLETTVNATSYIQNLSNVLNARVADTIVLNIAGWNRNAWNFFTPRNPVAGYTICANLCVLQASNTATYPRLFQLTDNGGSTTKYGIVYGNPDADGARLRGMQWYNSFPTPRYNEPSFGYTEPGTVSGIQQYPFTTIAFSSFMDGVIGSFNVTHRDGILRAALTEEIDPSLSLEDFRDQLMGSSSDHPIVWWRWLEYMPQGFAFNYDDMTRLSFRQYWR